MLVLHSARTPHRRATKRVGLAIAGGGPLGGIYELGALRALEEAIAGLDLTNMDVYVGISSGALIAAGLANRLETAELCRIFVTGDSLEAHFRPETFVRPAVLEYLRSVAGVPGMLLRWFTDVARHPFAPHLSDTLLQFGSVLPTGLFDNSGIERFLEQVLTGGGRSNDFRTLKRPLYVIAAELDSGKAVRFGDRQHLDVPISRAIVASAALPGLYPPVKIGAKFYVDGALQRTMHASAALDAGADLVIGVNPLVPFDAASARAKGRNTPESLIENGLLAVLSQTFRTLLQSRVQSSVAKYTREYAHADVMVFEPDADDAEMFFTNVFSFSGRERMAEHAYQATRIDLRARASELAPVLKRHGLALRQDVLADPHRTLVGGLRAKVPARTRTTARLQRALDALDRKLPVDTGRKRSASPSKAPRRKVR